MRVLITGASGFVGKHLIRELQQHGHQPLAFDLLQDRCLSAAVPSFSGDLLNSEQLLRLVGRVRPEACVHLGGISFVPDGWRQPQRMLTVNTLGTVNLLEAFRKAASSARVLVVSSAEIYGSQPRSAPITEDEPANPDNPYAVSKAAADQMALLYARNYAMPVMTARPFNHIGPGQSTRFAAPSFAQQLLQIARQQAPPVLKTGNLENQRDFTDVRDVARAYRLLIESAKVGQAYNIASGRAVALSKVLDKLCEIIGLRPTLEKDPSRFRPLEPRPQLAITKIAAAVHWQAAIPLEITLRDIVNELSQAL